MPLELTNQGIKTRTLQETISEMQQSAIEKEGEGFQVGQETPLGKILITAGAEPANSTEQSLQFVIDQFFIDTATGIYLDRLGNPYHFRQKQQKTMVTCYVAGTPETIIPSGSNIKDHQNTLFQTKNDVTIGGSGEIAISSITRSGTTATATTSANHLFSNDDIVFINNVTEEDYNGIKKVYNVTANTFDFDILNTPTTPATISNETNCLKGTAVTCEANDFGAISATSNTLNNVATTIVGWDYVNNYDDGILGRLEETDDEFRQRIIETKSILGGGHTDAIRSAVLNVSGVTECVVYSNTTESIDSSGRIPYSVEVFVTGGDDTEVATAIFETGSTPFTSYGNTSITVYNSSNQAQIIYFSRLIEVDIYVSITLEVNSDPLQGDIYPTDGNQQIIDNLTALSFRGGQDLWKSYLSAAITKTTGIINTTLTFGTSPNPTTDTTIETNESQKINLSSSRISITIQ